jgi:hypothetical protein
MLENENETKKTIPGDVAMVHVAARHCHRHHRGMVCGNLNIAS